MGVLVYAQAHLRLDIKEGWYEKLGQWDNALEAYRRKAAAAEVALRQAGVGLGGQPIVNKPPADGGSRGQQQSGENGGERSSFDGDGGGRVELSPTPLS